MPSKDSFADKVIKSLNNTANDIIRPFLAGPAGEGGGTGFSAGVDNPGISGIAQSTMLKDIIIVPSAGAGDSVFSYSQLDFKLLAKQNSYANLDPTEIKVSLYNYGERVTGNNFDTPMLVMGGSWGGTTWAPSANWGLGSNNSAGPGFINYPLGSGNLIYFKPATSAIYASLINDVGFYSNQSDKTITFRAFDTPVPGSLSVPSTTIVFGGSGASNTLQIEGSTVEAQNVNVRFRSPFTVSNSTVTDTLSLGLSSSASTGGTIYFSGGTRPKYVLSTEAGTFNTGDIFYAGSGNTLIRVGIGQSHQALTILPGANRVPTWSAVGGSSISLQNQSGINSASGEGWNYYPILSSALSDTNKVVGTDSGLTFNIGNDTLTTGRLNTASSIGYGIGISTAGIAFSYWFVPFRSTGTARSDAFIMLDNNNSTIKFVRSSDGDGLGNPSGSVRSFISLTSWGINTNVQAGALNVGGDVFIGRTDTAAITNRSLYFGNLVVLSQFALGTGVTGSSLTKVGTISEGVWSATAITTNYGGIGQQTPFTRGDILYAGSSTTLGKLSAGANGFILTSAGTATTPTYKDPATITVGLATSTTRAYGVDIVSTDSSSLHYLALTTSSSSASGTGLSTTDGISVNPNDNTITATRFIGDLAGFANTANNMRVVDADAGSGEHWILISRPDTGAGVAVSADTDFKFEPDKNLLSVPHISGTAFTAIDLTGTIRTASQNSITSATSLAAVGTITQGTWNANIIPTQYGGSGANLSGLGNSNKIPVLSSNSAQFNTIDSSTAGRLLVAQGLDSAPSFSNSSSAEFSFTNNLNVNGLVISGSATRSSAVSLASDLATKAYVDSISSGILPKGIVKFTTTAGIAASYRKASSIANSDSDIGGFLISTTQNALVSDELGFDNISPTNPAVGDRVLIKNGVTGGFGSGSDPYISFDSVLSSGSFGSSYIANGVYTILSLGSGSSNWILERDTLVDTTSELKGGTYVFVDRGATFADYSFICDNSAQTSFGSTQFSFIEFSQAAGIEVEQGLQKVGQTLATNLNLDYGDNDGVRYRTLRVGGNRTTGSTGFSTWPRFVVTSDSAVAKDLTLTNKTTGFTLSGGDTAKTLTVEDSVKFAGNQGLTVTTGIDTLIIAQDGDFDVRYDIVGSDLLIFDRKSNNSFSISHGSGYGFTFSDALDEDNTLRLSAIKNTSYIQTRGQIQFRASGTSAAENYIVNNGQTQYQLSTTASSFSPGDIFYGGAGSGHTALARLGIGAATGASVLLKVAGQPIWGRISLTDTNHINGILGFANGGTGSTSLNYNTNGVVVSSGSSFHSYSGMTFVSGTGLTISGTISSNGDIVSSSGNFVSGSNRLPIGTGSATRIAYWSDTNTLASSNTLTYIPNAGSGAALTIAPTSTAATAVRINGSNTSGNLLELMNSDTLRLNVKFDGPMSLNSVSTTDTPLSINGANSSGDLFTVSQSSTPIFNIGYDGNSLISGSANTTLTIYGGRTLLAPATVNYSSLNIAVSDSNVNPGAGNTFDGDLWYNGTNLYFQSSTELFDLLNTGTVQGSGIAGQLAKWETGTGLTHAQIADAVGLGVTVTSLSEGVASGNGATAYLTIQSVTADQTNANKFNAYFIRGIQADGSRMFSVDVTGHLRATTKSFDIPHPTKPGKRLVYGALEGPEHGVYHRDTIQGIGVIDVILPEYWPKLVGENYTIQITPWGNYNIKIVDKRENQFTVGLIGIPIFNKNKHYKFDYIIHGSRKDAPLDIEQ